MGVLPKDRDLDCNRPFSVTGCDLFGPIIVVENIKSLKRWGCIFVSFASRAVHLEVCYNLSCDSFLEAFFSLFNSRGHATRKLWSDNGTNLVAGAKILRHRFDKVKWKG